MMHEPTRRVLLLGWDAADWRMIDPLLAAGRMPHLKALLQSGIRASLATLEPRLSPLLWNSIATGKTADKHGILNFLEPDPSGRGIRIASSTTRRTQALWNMLTQAGLPTIAVNWYASHPAEPIGGVCVSNTFQDACPDTDRGDWPLPAGAVHPPALAERIRRSRVRRSSETSRRLDRSAPDVGRLGRDDPRRHILERLLRHFENVRNAALEAMAAAPAWRCAMVFFDTIDVAGHHFMQYHPPRMPHIAPQDSRVLDQVMNAVYEIHDDLLGVFLERCGPETTILIVSDHGFHCDHLRPQRGIDPKDEHAAMDATWHAPAGIIAMGGPGIRPGAVIAAPRVLDITPTVLTILHLPIGEDMDGRALLEALDGPIEPQRIPSWDAGNSESGMHPVDLRVDPIESHEALQQLVDLGYVAALPDDLAEQIRVVRNETSFNLAVVYNTTGRPNLAEPLLQSLHRQNPDEPRYALALASSLLSAGRVAQAIEVLQRFLTHHSDNLEASLVLAGALGAADRIKDGLDLMRCSVQRAETMTSLATATGDAFINLGEWDAAAAHYAAATEFNPSDAMAHLGLGMAAIGAGRFEHAIDPLLRSAELQPAHPATHAWLGAALAWLNEHDHALRSFDMSLRLQPGLIEALRFREAILRHQGRLQDARVALAAVERLMSCAAEDQQQPRPSPLEARAGSAAWASRPTSPAV